MTNNESITIYASYEDRGLMSTLPLIAEKWGFTIQNVPEFEKFSEIVKSQKLYFDNEVFLFELKSYGN